MAKKLTVGDYKANEATLRHQFDVILPFVPEQRREAFIQDIWQGFGKDADTSIRLSYGPKSKEFERKFSAIHGCEYGILSNSGTSSLQVALQALKEIYGWQDGDEVIVPATTFVATANIILHNNLKPVFVDVMRGNYGPYHYGLNMGTPFQRLNFDKVKCIIPVHLFGMPFPCYYLRWYLDDIGYKNIKIIEDACESAFAKEVNFHSLPSHLTSELPREVGAMGDIGCFSFYVAHTLTTGVGGMTTTNNPEYAAKMRSLVNHGWDRTTRPIDVTEFDIEEIKNRYRYSAVGHSFRVTELEAALGLAQLESWEADLERRFRNVKDITKQLQPFADKGLLQLPPSIPSLMMYPIVLLQGDKWDLIELLEKDLIETREMLPLINQPIYKDLLNPDDYPVSQWLIENGFYIGCHHYLDEDTIERIGIVFSEYFKGVV